MDTSRQIAWKCFRSMDGDLGQGTAGLDGEGVLAHVLHLAQHALYRPQHQPVCVPATRSAQSNRMGSRNCTHNHTSCFLNGCMACCQLPGGVWTRSLHAAVAASLTIRCLCGGSQDCIAIAQVLFAISLKSSKGVPIEDNGAVAKSGHNENGAREVEDGAELAVPACCTTNP